MKLKSVILFLIMLVVWICISLFLSYLIFGFGLAFGFAKTETFLKVSWFFVFFTPLILLKHIIKNPH